MGICSSTGCTRIPCGKMAGTYGCFMKLSEDVKRRLLEDNVKNYSVYAGTDREANLNVDGTLMTNLINKLSNPGDNVYFKLLKPGTAEHEYGTECNAIKILRQVMTPDQFSSLTTYEPFENHGYAFRIVLDEHQVSLDNIMLKVLHIVIARMCEGDLQTRNFDPLKFVKDIGPTMKILHTNEYTHMDIKHANVVVCDGTYRLIDYGMLKKRTENSNWSGTPAYVLPTLLTHTKYGLVPGKVVIKDGRATQTLEYAVNLFSLNDVSYALYPKPVKPYCFKKSDEYAVACMIVSQLPPNSLHWSNETEQLTLDSDVQDSKALSPILTTLLGPYLYFQDTFSVSGGASKTSRVMFGGRQYVVRKDALGKYISVAKARVHLSDIRRRYRYVK